MICAQGSGDVISLLRLSGETMFSNEVRRLMEDSEKSREVGMGSEGMLMIFFIGLGGKGGAFFFSIPAGAVADGVIDGGAIEAVTTDSIDEPKGSCD